MFDQRSGAYTRLAIIDEATEMVRSRSPYTWTEAKVRRRQREGRGQGVGVDYGPWLTVRDFPSLGRTHRVRGMTVDRPYQLLSDGEFRLFVIYDWDERVIDIREQYPLDRQQTYQIARKLGYRHPTTSCGTPNVMTTDFLLTMADGRLAARTYKPSERLMNKRVAQKLQIEATYWADKDVDWAVVTEQNINRTQFVNIDAVRGHYYLDGIWQPGSGAIESACEELINLVVEYPTLVLREACHQVASNHAGYTTEFVFAATKHLIARKVLRTDMIAPTPITKRTLGSFALKADWSVVHDIR